MSGFKKEDDENELFSSAMDKTVVLQEARAFHEAPVNPRKCRLILTRIAYICFQSEHLLPTEATDAFFAATKLFQNNDIPLRQSLYLVIKALAPFAQDIIIATSSITKDINAKGDPIYKPNAIRALGVIIDPSMIPAVERFLKQAIVDRNPSVASAALVTSLHMFNSSKEVVKRWANEVSEAVNSKGMITQYHALGLLYLTKQHDRMSVLKLIQSLSRGNLRSPFAFCMLIRYTVKMVEDGLPDADRRACLELLEGWLRHKSDMVVYEAARSICRLAEIDGAAVGKEVLSAVSALQLMLVNHRPALRFAAIRTLNKLAQTQPTAVTSCNLDMESLITDNNRSIATLAITTLLKTGTESGVDRLMKQISGFMGEISDEFKVIVVDAVRSLCLKFPNKQGVLLAFLANILRDEGGFEYKKAIVDAVVDVVKGRGEGREVALSHLCEFIEDCEFTKLAVRILHLLGSEGPHTEQPSKYIRYIYNRVILENATVRAAAVSALARFAVEREELRERIKVLLERCLDDVDDEVRDRATFYLSLLRNGSQDSWKVFVNSNEMYSYTALEHSLVQYMQSADHNTPFNLSQVPVITKEQEAAEELRLKRLAIEPIKSSTRSPTTATASEAGAAKAAPVHTGRPLRIEEMQSRYLSLVEKIPQLASLGPLLKSSTEIALTEAETEYVVKCTKHIVGEYVVFQFDITNTLAEVVLANVTVQMAPEDVVGGLQPAFMVPVERLAVNETGTCWVVWKRGPNPLVPVTADFKCGLKFLVMEVDTASGTVDEEGYEDEYMVEELELTIADYMMPQYLQANSFMQQFEALPHESVETYQLTAIGSIKAAVSSVLDMLGMAPCDNTDAVRDKAPTHQLLLAGTCFGNVPTLARVRMVWEATTGVALEVAVRSGNEAVAETVANAIA